MRSLFLLLLFSLVGLGGPSITAQSTAPAPAAAPLERTASIYFASESSVLDAEARATVAEFTRTLASYADFSVRVEAFTDEQGTAVYNEGLARRRATATLQALEELAATTTGLEVRTFGERAARTNTETDAERRSDRRVDLIATVTPYAEVAELTRALRQPRVQRIPVQTDEVRVISGEQGAQILVPTNALVRADGTPYAGTATYELIEAYELADILLAGLTTHAGDRLLETGGMIKLTASDSLGHPLELAPGVELAASIPTAEVLPGMQLFAGGHGAPPESWVEIADGEVVGEMDGLTAFSCNRSLEDRLADRNIQLAIEKIKMSSRAAWAAANPPPAAFTQARPSVPVRPRPIDTTRIRAYRPTGVRGMFVSDAKLAEQQRAATERAQRQYARHLARYEENALSYDKQIKRYETRKAASEVALTAYKSERSAAYTRISETIDARFRDKLARAEEDCRRQYATYYMELYGDLDAEGLADAVNSGSLNINRYFFSVGQLGWINCDRYYDVEETVEIIASIPGAAPGSFAVLIPDDINSVLNLHYRKDGQWSVQGFPRDLGYQIVTYFIEDGQLRFARHRVTAAGDAAVEVAAEPIAADQLLQRLHSVTSS